jgi:predicted PurR-regulated permease PerM
MTDLPRPLRKTPETCIDDAPRPFDASRGGSAAKHKERDLTRTTLAVLFIGGLIAVSFWIVWPFLPAVVWSAMIVIATWPIMRRIQAQLWDSRALAVIVMVAALLLMLVLPLSLAVISIVSNADEIATWAKSLASIKVPPPPEWLGRYPIIGEPAVRTWENLSTIKIETLTSKAAPYAFDVTKWFISQAGGIGIMLVHFLLTVVISAILYTRGEWAAAAFRQFGRRLAGERGETSVRLAGQAIRGVALGVIVTALVQSTLAGIGLGIAGVPSATLLTAVMFMLCIAQIGPILVLLPAVVWMYWSGDAGWATFLLLWSVPVFTLDNFLRPALIKRGVDLPFILIFVGVIGGLIGFGLVGIFVGPVVLAVAYTLLAAWMADQPEQPPALPAD